MKINSFQFPSIKVYILLFILIGFALINSSKVHGQSILTNSPLRVCTNGEAEIEADTIHLPSQTSIRWQLKFAGDSFRDINSGIIVQASGENTSTLTLNGSQFLLDGFDLAMLRFIRFNPGDPSDSTISLNTLVLQVGDTTEDLNPIMPASPQICPGESIDLSTSDDSTNGMYDRIVWSDMPDFSTEIGTTGSISVDAGGTYYVRREGCDTSGVENVIVEEKDAPIPLESITSSQNSICEGETATITLTANGNSLGTGGKIKWYVIHSSITTLIDSGQSIQVSVMSDTSFMARIEADCDTTEFESISIISTPPPSIENLMVSQNPVCQGDEITISADITSGVDILWNFGNEANISTDTGPGPKMISFIDSGSQTIMITAGADECDTTKSVTVEVAPSFEILINGSNTDTSFALVEGSLSNYQLTISEDQTVAFSWDCDLISGNVLGNENAQGQDTVLQATWDLATNSDEACFVCTITASALPCIDTKEIKITVSRLIDIPDVITPNGDTKNDTWQITFTEGSELEAEDFKIKLYNRYGKCVMGCTEDLNVSNFSGPTPMDLNLPDGAYFYTIENAEAKFLRKGSLTILGN